MVTVVGLVAVFATYRISLRYPEATVAVWITFAVVVASSIAEWSSQ